MYAAAAGTETHAGPKNVWCELSVRAHFNINELSGNNSVVPLPPHGVGLKEAEGAPGWPATVW